MNCYNRTSLYKHFCCYGLLFGALSIASAHAYAFQQDETEHPVSAVSGSIVGIEVTNSASDGAASSIKRGSGLLIRRDGFVLTNISLLDRSIVVAGQSEYAGKQTIRVTLHPGDQKQEAIAAVKSFDPGDKAGVIVLKLKTLQPTAGKVALPSVIAPGDDVEILSTKWDAAGARFIHNPPKASKLGDFEKDSDDGALSVPFQTPVETSAGSVVTKSGVAVGIVNSAPNGIAKSFYTFARLHLATNCVAADSLLPGEKSPAMLAGKEVKEMVRVGAGKFQLAAAVSSMQPDNGPNEAAIAPFEMDKYKVTNRQYLDFWMTFPASERRKLSVQNRYFPKSWSMDGEPFPAEIADYPVLNVSLIGARAYATWQGKRIPTPYEWSLAAFGVDGDNGAPSWIGEYLKDRQEMWKSITRSHQEYYQQLKAAQMLGDGTDWNNIPWLARTPAAERAARWSKQTIERMIDSLTTKWKEPLQITASGQHDYDVSPSGVSDMLMNGAEMILPNPGLPVRGEQTYLRANWSMARSNSETVSIFGLSRSEIVFGRRSGHVPLSHLVRRTVTSPENQDLLASSNLEDILSLLTPISAFQLEATKEDFITAVGPQRLPNTPAAMQRPFGLLMWAGYPQHVHRELGINTPLEGHENRYSTAAGLQYLVPYGYRCVR